MRVGFHCSHEQHPPSRLLELAKRADDAGFGAAMCSDHFHPWSVRQGHAGAAWSWLGAALASTSMSFGTVCAPGQRYHPAVIAQAAATLAEMFPGRFWLALGSGEALNEAITGEPWPPKPARRQRLQACVAIMRALWAGETVSVRGPVNVHNATLYVHAARRPLVVGAALTPDTARWVGTWADALITVAGPRDDMRAVVEAFRTEAGPHKPMFLQVALAYADSDAASQAAAYHQWRQSALSGDQLADLDTPAAFDAACAAAPLEQVLEHVRVSADIERQLAWLEQDAALGFAGVYLHNVARDHQERFIDACARRVLPALAGALSRS